MNSKQSNIPKELASAPSGDLKYKPQDPVMAEALKEMTKEAQDFLESKRETPEGETVEPRVDIPPNPEFSSDPPGQMITEALVSLNSVVIQDFEKELFLKAVLNDHPIRLTVELYRKSLRVNFRSRSTYEQKRIYDVMEFDQKEKYVDPANLALNVTRLQYYLAALMVERINDSLFSDLVLVPGQPIEKDAETLRTFVAKNLEGMTQVRWNSILNALRIFENKCAKLSSEAANEDFWAPRGSDS